MPKTLVETTVMETRNAPTAAKTGRQRAASHNNIGNSQAIGNTVSQVSGGSEIIIPVIAASATSAAVPSMTSLRGGGSRRAEASPITNGATVTMPKASEANQWCQVVRIGVVGLWNNLYAAAPPIPETAVPTTAASSSPSTWRSLSRLKVEPK